MRNKIEDIHMKNSTYYFLDDIINIKNFHPNNIEIDGKSYKKYYHLWYWKCDGQWFEISKNQ